MRIARFAHDGRVLAGIVEDSAVRPFAEGHGAIAEGLRDLDAARHAARASTPIPLDAVALFAPVDATARVFAVAQNYRAHAQEASGTDVPPAPIVFLKPVSA